MSDDLQHYGVKGMKWGVRRYQPYTGTKKFKDARKKKNKGRVSKAREGIKKGISENQSMAKDNNQSAEWKKRASKSVRDLKKADKKLANIDTGQSRKDVRKQVKKITNEVNNKTYAEAKSKDGLNKKLPNAAIGAATALALNSVTAGPAAMAGRAMYGDLGGISGSLASMAVSIKTGYEVYERLNEG